MSAKVWGGGNRDPPTEVGKAASPFCLDRPVGGVLVEGDREN